MRMVGLSVCRLSRKFQGQCLSLSAAELDLCVLTYFLLKNDIRNRPMPHWLSAGVIIRPSEPVSTILTEEQFNSIPTMIYQQTCPKSDHGDSRADGLDLDDAENDVDAPESVSTTVTVNAEQAEAGNVPVSLGALPRHRITPRQLARFALYVLTTLNRVNRSWSFLDAYTPFIRTASIHGSQSVKDAVLCARRMCLRNKTQLRTMRTRRLRLAKRQWRSRGIPMTTEHERGTWNGPLDCDSRDMPW